MVSSRNQPSAPSRALLTSAFVGYLVLLAWVVLWKLEVPWIGDAAPLLRPLNWCRSYPVETPGPAPRSKC